ncbi:hypothetical protein [Pseudomonas typographi]|uniref:Uncharacterized protein n=1 Tax=Pseudomonas typographi TaxID=2715964 RepID=A0ABR7Z8R6_9PSED|nr:hypothetical protein [Pseudomonas typographi]MBD1553896.1 hypothetical protein [Pseudomonas typographi]MBD1589702.1 hypothetical protein [Pseudomonas typographi]MBD1601731.1 hypothetical protein [Pseudomonas typographi]
MSNISNPVQIVASALAMRPTQTEPAANDNDEPPERRSPRPLPRRVRQRLKKT